MPVIFSHSKFINFTIQTAAQQADINPMIVDCCGC